MTLIVLYVVAGVLFAIAFVTWGAGRVDANARGAPLSFRLLIFPGCVALWPLLLRKWLEARHDKADET